VISDTASYSDDIFTLHIAIMSCIAICAFPKSPYSDLLSNEPMVDLTMVDDISHNPVFVVFTCYGSHRAES
jgi:hypothetical protein